MANKWSPSIIFCLLFCSVAIADESRNDYDAMYDECVSSSGPINNAVVYGCAEDVSAQVKKEMTELYKTLYAKLAEQSEEDAKRFEHSQMGWLKYRNGHCELKGSYVGSPMYSVCPMEMNVERVKELRELVGEL